MACLLFLLYNFQLFGHPFCPIISGHSSHTIYAAHEHKVHNDKRIECYWAIEDDLSRPVCSEKVKNPALNQKGIASGYHFFFQGKIFQPNAKTWIQYPKELGKARKH